MFIALNLQLLICEVATKHAEKMLALFVIIIYMLLSLVQASSSMPDVTIQSSQNPRRLLNPQLTDKEIEVSEINRLLNKYQSIGLNGVADSKILGFWVESIWSFPVLVCLLGFSLPPGYLLSTSGGPEARESPRWPTAPHERPATLQPKLLHL